MGHMNFEFPDGRVESIVEGEIVTPAETVHHDPRWPAPVSNAQEYASMSASSFTEVP